MSQSPAACDRMAGAEQGGRVYEVFAGSRSLDEPVSSGTVELAFGHGAIDLDRLRPGQKVWKTDDPELSRRLRKTFATPDPQRRIDVDLEFDATVGGPLRILARAACGASCRLESAESLQEARKHPLSLELLREQFGRLGGSVYRLRRVDARIEGRPMVPLSVLGKLRHELVRRLDAAIAKPHGLTVALKSPLPTLRERGPATLSDNRQPTTDNYRHASPSDNRQLTTDNHLLTTDNYLEVLCRSLDQLRTVLACGVANVTVDFRDIREYGEAVRLAHAGGAAIFDRHSPHPETG